MRWGGFLESHGRREAGPLRKRGGLNGASIDILDISVTQRSCWTSTEATCVPGRRGERVCSCLSDLCNLHSVLASLRNSSKQCGAHTWNVLLDNVLICLLYLYCNKVLQEPIIRNTVVLYLHNCACWILEVIQILIQEVFNAIRSLFSEEKFLF